MTLQSSGAISFADLKAEFGDSNPVSLADYYRGGSLVPSTKGGREPSTGYLFEPTRQPSNATPPNYGFELHTDYYEDQNGTKLTSIYWAGVRVTTVSGHKSSVAHGGATYYRGTLKDSYNSIYTDFDDYSIYRVSPSTQINQSVPTSGAINLGDFYGAQG